MINIYNAEGYEALLKKAIGTALKRFSVNEKDVDIEIELIDAEEMQELNKNEREIDAVTDVLSFPAIECKLPFRKKDYKDDINPENGAVILGEIYICLERAKEQAEEFNHSVSREIGFLATHGVLHLLGFDHIEETAREEMEKLQNDILTEAGITRDIKDGEIKEDAAPAEALIKTGYIAVLGRPNAGKSTLVNTLVGEKVSIVSWKPQTTRNRIFGIMNTPDSQVIFVDTPGIHAPRNALGKFMMRSVTAALEGVDAVLYVIDGEKGIDKFDRDNLTRYIEAGKKVIAAVNKIDHITKEKVVEILTVLNGYPALQAVVPVSAIRNRNTDALKGEIDKLLKPGKREFSEDIYTDKSLRFMAAEIIREKALRLLDEEIPFGIGVSINKYEQKKNGVTEIDADVICQKEAHKPIILGKDGAMIKKISTYARQDIEAMTGGKVYLTLWVRVKEDWRDDVNMLNELGYNKDNY